MTDQLDDLFKQIIQSEKKAQEKKATLEIVRADIENNKAKLKDTDDECKSLQGQLALKVHQLSEGEMRLKFLQNRSKILKQQRDILDEEFKQSVGQKKELQSRLDKDAEDFSTFVEAYCSEYDLVASLNNQRNITTQARIDQLKKEEKELLEGLSTFNVKQESIDRLTESSASIEKDIQHKVLRSKELAERINQELREKEKLKGEKEVVCNVPQTGQEFQRLNKELESYNEIGRELDDACSSLQAELHQLKQAKWQNQLQQTRVQQQQNQRRIKSQNATKETSMTSTNFKRISNFNNSPSFHEENDLRSDFIAASALLEEDDELLENNFTAAPSSGKKPNLSKITEAVRSKKSDQLGGDQPSWRFQRTGKFQFKKAGK